MIKDLPKNEQPREKLIKGGVGALTNTELIALILRTGSRGVSPITLARKVLDNTANIKNLHNLTIQELANYTGIGIAKGASLIAAAELGLRIVNYQETVTYIFTPKETYEYIKPRIFAKTEEYLYMLSLDSRNKLINCDLVTKGTVRESLVNPREIYKKALQRNAVFIILVHNHPSNEVSPSKEDIESTKEIQLAGKMIGIPLLDHLIVSDSTYTSLKSYM